MQAACSSETTVSTNMIKDVTSPNGSQSELDSTCYILSIVRSFNYSVQLKQSMMDMRFPQLRKLRVVPSSMCQRVVQ
jgi:hypothetical protein